MLQTSDTIDNRPFLCYIFYMTEETEKNEKPSYNRLRGCHKNIPGASVEDFLARSRADKEHEFEIERRQEEERARLKAAGKMSFADTILVATAVCTGATVVTCDHIEFEPVEKQKMVPFLWIRP